MDKAHRQTDIELNRIEREMRSVFNEAKKELGIHTNRFLNKFEKESNQKLQQVENGEISIEDYKQWLSTEIKRDKQYKAFLVGAGLILLSATEKSIDRATDRFIGIYSINQSFIAKKVNKKTPAFITPLKVKDVEKKNITLEQRQLNRVKNKAWNNKIIKRQIQQGINNGESIPKIANRIVNNTTLSNYKQAVTYARTNCTSIENQGRLDALFSAKENGIDVKKMWLATLDERTRDWHAILNGEIVELEDTFSNGLMKPGDVTGSPAETYNCRCALAGVINGVQI